MLDFAAAWSAACKGGLLLANVHNPLLNLSVDASEIVEDERQIRQMLLDYPTWWTRPAARLRQVIDSYRDHGFEEDTISFIFKGERAYPAKTFCLQQSLLRARLLQLATPYSQAPRV